jgi:gliding motility-associated-like protein
LFCILSVTAAAQFVNNASFEGTPQQGVPPNGWVPCNTYSTPDTQPGHWLVNRSASEGSTYISLFTRGIGGYLNDNTKEGIGTGLMTPLEKNKCYNLSIDLAFFPTATFFDPWGPTIVYNTPVLLNVWGGSQSCEKKELLYKSQPITNQDWITYNFAVTPSENITHIILEADFSTAGPTYGNILIDHLVVETNTLDLGPDRIACEGENVDITVGIPESSVTWNTGATGKTISITEEGNYTAAVSKNGCNWTDQISIFFLGPVSIQLPEDTTICRGDTVVVDATTVGVQHHWSDGSGTAVRNFFSEGTYQLTISNGCFSASDEMSISVNDTLCCPPLKVPNVFTPNNDGKNDFFEITGPTDNQEEFYLKIYNRWGQLVYSSSSISDYWNGRNSDGKISDDGIYFWTAKTRCTNRNILLSASELRGIVTLLR